MHSFYAFVDVNFCAIVHLCDRRHGYRRGNSMLCVWQWATERERARLSISVLFFEQQTNKKWKLLSTITSAIFPLLSAQAQALLLRFVRGSSSSLHLSCRLCVRSCAVPQLTQQRRTHSNAQRKRIEPRKLSALDAFAQQRRTKKLSDQIEMKCNANCIVAFE